jgi:hypothetical protein
LLLAQRLGQAVDLIAEGVFLVPQVGHLGLEAVVLALQGVQRGHNVIQFVEALENLRAAIGLLREGILDGGNLRQNLADLPVADHIALSIAHFQRDAAVHEAAFFGGIVDFGNPLAFARSGDLIGGGAIFEQEAPDRIGALQRELVVISRRAHIVRIADHFDPVILVLVQQFSQAKQTGVPIR